MPKAGEASPAAESSKSTAVSARFLQPLLAPILLLVLGLSLFNFYSLPTLFTSGPEFGSDVALKHTVVSRSVRLEDVES